MKHLNLRIKKEDLLRIPPWARGALAAGLLMLVIGLIFWLNPFAGDSAASESLPPESASINAFAPYASAEIKQAWEKNNDTAGWLALPGCDINDPVMQGADNDEYLRRTEFSSAYNIWGCYFLDYTNTNDGYTLLSRVSVVYGHSLDDTPNSKKFSKLKQFEDPAFCKANQSFTFSLLYASQAYSIFSACKIPVSMDYINPNPDDAEYQALLTYLLENSSYDFGVNVATSDHIMLLSTCTSNENERYVVAGVKKAG